MVQILPQKYFPLKDIRDQQDDILTWFKENHDNGKKYFFIEAGTGVGKSAVGISIGRYLANHYGSKIDEEFINSYYVLTTQKILQQQYTDDFSRKCSFLELKSSTNYSCSRLKGASCAEGLRGLKVADRNSPYFKHCISRCNYKLAKDDFLQAEGGVTNFAYFLAETNYAGKLKPRRALVIDEAHNVPDELSKFISVSFSQRFTESYLKISMPGLKTQYQAHQWISKTYYPVLIKRVAHFEKMMEKYANLREKLNEFTKLAQRFEVLDKHMCKIKRFLDVYQKDNWVYSMRSFDGKKKIEFKPIDVAPFAHDMLLRNGQYCVFMSATLVNFDAHCEMLGIPKDQACFISLPSPFDNKHRPIMIQGIGSMSSSSIDKTLPKLAIAVSEILSQHNNEKGIIHCHTYRIANYLKNNVKSNRLLIHNSDNRDGILREHITSKKPTVLLSPSMTEGVDLKDSASRFQIICKVPYPYLGDDLIRKKMNRWKWWYPMQTSKTVLQSIGRSVRNREDYAITYILDSDWVRFMTKNKAFLTEDFLQCILQ